MSTCSFLTFSAYLYKKKEVIIPPFFYPYFNY